MSTSCSKHQTDVNMRWDRQENRKAWWKTDCVNELCVTELCMIDLYVKELGVKNVL